MIVRFGLLCRQNGYTMTWSGSEAILSKGDVQVRCGLRKDVPVINYVKTGEEPMSSDEELSDVSSTSDSSDTNPSSDDPPSLVDPESSSDDNANVGDESESSSGEDLRRFPGVTWCVMLTVL